MIRYACLFDKKDSSFAAYHSEWCSDAWPIRRRKLQFLEKQTLVDFDDSKLVKHKELGSESDT